MCMLRWAVGLLLLCEGTVLASERHGAGRRLMQEGSEFSGVQPRMNMLDIDDMSETQPYRVLMLLAWQQLTTSSRRNSPYSYWQLAGVHGKSWAYNGVDAPTSGFCLHQESSFGPWHRAYLRQFELALVDAAHIAASDFRDPRLRAQYGALAGSIRLPYWDWTSARIPGLLTADGVTVLDFESGQPTRIRNPFGNYEYVASAGDGRNTGRQISRGSSWASTMSRSSRRFGMEMASFIRSNNWRCSYLGSSRCSGNLESTHNEIHNVLGGTNGEMATVLYAGFDPLFWLHHGMIDRVLWLFQNNGGQWMGTSSYSPFLNLRGDAADISSYGYTYSTGRPVTEDPPPSSGWTPPSRGGRRGGRRGRRADTASAAAALQQDATLQPAPGGTGTAAIGSAAGKAAVRAAIQQWTGNYTGFAWAVRFLELDPHQMEGPVHVMVYLKPLSAQVQTIPAKVNDLNELRSQRGYCGSISGFNVHVHPKQKTHESLSRAVDLTECLRESGLNPDVPPADPSDPSKGPAKASVRLSDLQLVAVDAQGVDVTDKYSFGKTVVSWMRPTTRTAAQVRAAAVSDPIEAQALAHPLAFTPQQEVLSMDAGDVGEA